MLEPDSRALLLDALRPPPGYSLDRAVATTFTLDLQTALMVPLAFAGLRFQSQPDPIEVMQALREMSGRFDLFCQAGGIRPGGWPSDLVSLLEDVIHEVRRPRPGHIFHPKLWVLRFVDDSAEPAFRLLVLSRNLTADRSWDTILWLDGRMGHRTLAINNALARFVAALADLTTTRVAAARRAAIEALADELRRVEWELPPGVRELRFHPSGLLGLPRLDAQRVLDGYRRLVVSPFVTAGALAWLFDQAPPGGAILVSRGEEMDALPAGALDGIEAFELDPMAGLSSDDDGDGQAPSVLSGLHAKLFVVERARRAHLFVGSTNGTDAGFSGNVEFLCELVGSPSAIGVSALVGEGARFRAMLKPYSPPDEPVVDEDAEQLRQLEELLFDLAQVGFCLEASERATGWAACVTSEAPLPRTPDGTRISLAPHNRPAETAAVVPGTLVEVEWPPRSAADLTPFLRLTVTRTTGARTIERSTVVCAKLTGAPPSRLEEIFARQIDTPGKFLRLLALLLGLDAHGALGGELATDGVSARWVGAGTGVLELLARALAERPEAIDQLESIVEHLRRNVGGRAILPDGWDGVWLPALEARRALAEAGP